MQQKIVTTLKHSITYSIASFVGQSIHIFLVPIYTRIFSPTAYGIMAGVNMVTPIISALIITIPRSSATRYYVDSKDNKDRRLTASVGLYQIIFLALLLVLPAVLFFPQELSLLVLKDTIYAKYFIIALLTVFFSVFYNYGMNIIRLNFQSTRYAVISIVRLLVGIGLSVLLVVVLRMDITGALAASLVTSILFCLAIMWLTKKYYARSFSTTKLKEMLRFGAPFIPAGMLGYILTYTDRYFIINYCSLSDLGLYSIGLSLASAISLLFFGFQRAWAPIVYSTYRDIDAKLFYSKLLDYAFSLAILAIVAVSIFSREILTVFTTEAYLDSYQVVPWLAFSMLFTQVLHWFVIGIEVAKKTIHHTWRAAVAVAVNIGLNFLLVPIYGMIGAAMGTLISAAVSYILRLIMSQRYYPIHFNFINYLKMTSIAIVVLLLWYNFFLEISWQNILIKLGFMLLLLLSIFVFKMVGRTELSYAKQVGAKYFGKLRPSRLFH